MFASTPGRFCLILFISCSFLFYSCQTKNKNVPPGATENSQKLPEGRGYVSDFEEIFSPEQELELAAIASEHEKKTTNQVVIVTIKSFEPYPTMEEYTIALANHWGVGQKSKKNNGVTIVLGKDIKEIFITQGLDLAGQFTSAESQSIIDSIMIPEYKEDRLFEGTRNGLEAIIAEITP